jgi:hypothetical protein
MIGKSCSTRSAKVSKPSYRRLERTCRGHVVRAAVQCKSPAWLSLGCGGFRRRPNIWFVQDVSALRKEWSQAALSFNWLEGRVCTTCAPGDQEKSYNSQCEQAFRSGVGPRQKDGRARHKFRRAGGSSSANEDRREMACAGLNTATPSTDIRPAADVSIGRIRHSLHQRGLHATKPLPPPTV